MKDLKKNTMILAGAAFATSLAMSVNAQADQNPFEVNQLSAGYQLAEGAEGKCGEGKCGEGKCGEDKKGGEGKCGEGKCGES